MNWSGVAVMKCQKNLSLRPHKLIFRASLFCRLCLPNGSVSLDLSGSGAFCEIGTSCLCVNVLRRELNQERKGIVVFSFAFQ